MFIRVNWTKWTVGLLMSAAVLAATGCASGKGGKKIKRGKPIPCPVKDC